jgi:hypothetical protein
MDQEPMENKDGSTPYPRAKHRMADKKEGTNQKMAKPRLERFFTSAIPHKRYFFGYQMKLESPSKS